MVAMIDILNKHEAAYRSLREKATPDEIAVLDDVLRVVGEMTAEVTDLRVKVADAAAALTPFSEYAKASKATNQDCSPVALAPQFPTYERAEKCVAILSAVPKAKETLSTMLLAVDVAEMCQQVHGLSMMFESNKIKDVGMLRRLQIAQGQLEAAVVCWAKHKKKLGAGDEKKIVL